METPLKTYLPLVLFSRRGPTMNRLPASDSWNPNGPSFQGSRAGSDAGRRGDGSVLAAPTGPQAFFLPCRYEANYQYPLVVWLHNDGGCETQVAEVMPHLSIQNYVAVGVRGTRASDAAGHRFDWLDSARGVIAAQRGVLDAVDAATRRYSVNPQRVFLAGYHEGGTMAQRIAMRHPERFAGVISLGGAFPRGCGPLANLHAARQMPVLMALATEGERYCVDSLSEDLRLFNTARLQLEVQQFAVADEMITPVLRQIDGWMMSIVTGQVRPRCVPDCDTTPVDFSIN